MDLEEKVKMDGDGQEQLKLFMRGRSRSIESQICLSAIGLNLVRENTHNIMYSGPNNGTMIKL
jgi:curli biogenesis system outer membrane secretion channel CsgG